MAKKVNAIDISVFVKKADYIAKIKDIEDKIPSITGLVTTSALTAAKTKVPKGSYLVKRAGYEAKMKGIKDKYFTAADYIDFTNDILDDKNKKIVNESDISGLINNTNFDENIKTLATKSE